MQQHAYGVYLCVTFICHLKYYAFFSAKEFHFNRDDRMKVIVSLYLITRCAFASFFFSSVLLLTWQHENKSHKSLSTCYLFRVWSLRYSRNLCVSAVEGKLSLYYQADDDGSTEKKITAAFYKCSPFKLLSWHLSESKRAERKRVDGFWYVNEQTYHALCVPCATKQAHIKTSNGLRKTCQFIVHIKLNRIHFVIVTFILINGIRFGDAIWKSVWSGLTLGLRFVAPLHLWI